MDKVDISNSTIKYRRLIMHNFLPRYFIFFLALCISGCGTRLSEKEAEEVIAKVLKYPQKISAHVSVSNRFSSSLEFKKMKNLFNDGGYFVQLRTESKGGYFTRILYKPTEKWQGTVSEPEYTKNTYFGDDQNYKFWAVVAEEKIRGIDEILIDETNKTAKISYSTYLEKVEPAFSMLCSDSKICKDALSGKNLNSLNKRQIVLKKYDKGWRRN